MSKLHQFKLKHYMKMKAKHPNVEYIYRTYKINNLPYHESHKITSWKFLSKLISADKRNKDLTKVAFPKETYNPFLTHSCSENYRLCVGEKCLAIPDSSLLKRKSPEKLVEELCKFEIISFDIFDTCIFRPFGKPTDLYYLLESQNGMLNFGDYRRNAEAAARQKTTKPNFEVDIYDIYEELEKRCFLKKEEVEREIEMEKKVCYANPYMLKVFELLKKKKKTVIAISDMYLPSKVVKEILEKNGFVGFEKIYVSCEHGYAKGQGKLFEIAKADYPTKTKFAHVGDSKEADIKGAQKAGVTPFYYEQCNEFGNKFRPQYLYSPVGQIYKGVVNNYLYNGTNKNTAREDFGFLYAGPIVAGYCEWINEFVKNNNLDKIWFLARDMDIFYKMYNKHYKKYDNDYVVTSRFSLQECLYEDFTDEILYHTLLSRCDRGYTIKQSFDELNLSFLIKECPKYGLNEKSFIFRSNLDTLHKVIKDNLDKVIEYFKDNETAAKMYFKEKLGGARKICLVDLGWRGSIFGYLKYLLVDKWKLCDEVKGVLLGSTYSEAAANLISRGIVTTYAYDHIHNRDFVRQDCGIEFTTVVVLESIFTSEGNSLVEYKLNKEKNQVEFLTYESNPNKKIIREFHTGVERFIDEFEKFRKEFRHVYPMSAVDAFEPMNIILKCQDYIARIVGDVLDTPYQVAGLGIKVQKYVPLGEIMLEKGLIKEWPIRDELEEDDDEEDDDEEDDEKHKNNDVKNKKKSKKK